MPLPAMVGDDETMLEGDRNQPPSQQGEVAQSQTDPQAQVRGAVETTSQIRTFNRTQLETLARQFPSIAKSAQELMQIIDQGVQRIVKELVKTVQTPEPTAPKMLR